MLEAADEVNLVRAASDRLLEELLDLLARGHLVERCREDDALALLQLTLEVTGREQVLVAVVTASQVLQILEVVVPIGCGYELGIGLRGLHIEPGERLVHAALYTVRCGIRMAVGLHVGLRQCVLVAEGEEGTQTELRLRVSINERVTNHKLGALVDPKHLLLQNHAAHSIGDRRGGGVLEVGDVLVATRLINALETVQRQVERLVVLHDRLVERREKHIGAIAVIDRSYNQTVIFTGVAAYDRRAHVTTDAVGREHLALEGILEVSKRGFVEC